MILARALHPWYDERFVGYGWDKVRCMQCRTCCVQQQCSLAVFARCTCLRIPQRWKVLRVISPPPQMGLPECLFFWGGSFVVHPHGFVVHVPHERSTTFHAYMKDGKKRSYEVRVLACMAALFAVMRVCGPDRLERARAVPILVTGSDQHRLPMVECEFRQPPPH